VWTELENVGWTTASGKRPQDQYYLPPGVVRGPGFLCRKDYFDSYSQVLKLLQTHADWTDTASEWVEMYEKCLRIKTASSKNPPAGGITVDWLVNKVCSGGKTAAEEDVKTVKARSTKLSPRISTRKETAGKVMTGKAEDKTKKKDVTTAADSIAAKNSKENTEGDANKPHSMFV